MDTVEPNTWPTGTSASEAPTTVALWRMKADRFFGGAMEGLLLIAICGSPWFLGSVGTTPRLLLYAGLLVLLVSWGIRMLLQGGIAWQKCPVTIVLALLFLSGIWQLVPLSPALLSALAPGTARVYEQMLPEQPEVLSDPAWKPLSASCLRISLNPQATRSEIMELLAVLLLFALVRNNIPAQAGLYRLSVGALANGVLLVCFAMLAPYDHGPFCAEEGTFGSFLSREHFVFYIEICLGLGMGVLLNRLGACNPSQRGAEATVPPKPALALRIGTLAIGVGVAILLGGLAFALSVGGSAAVVVAALFVWLVLLRSSRWRLAVAIALLLGAGAIGASLGWDTWVPQYSRWTRALACVQEFPVWGTGYGTFSQLADNQGLTNETDFQSIDSATSAFQVMLVEGGAVRVVLSLLVVGLVLLLGIWALRRHANGASAGLALGALLAVTAMVVHSLFDSGLQVLAVGVLTCVVGAYLCGLANGGADDREEPQVGPQLVWRLGGLAAPGGALVLLVLGMLLLGHGRRADTVQKLAQAAADLNLADDRNSRSRQLQLLEAAVQLSPAEAQLRLNLAQAHVRVWERKLDDLQRKSQTINFAQIVGAIVLEAGCASPQCRAENIGLWYLAMNWQDFEREKEASLEEQHLLPALQHCIEARNLSPASPEPHLRIAALGRMLDKADAPRVYRERAQRVAPRNAWVFYLCGVQESESGQNELAWRNWKESLELSDAYLFQILERCRHQMSSAQMLRQILAKRPQQLASAAIYLFADSEASTTQRRLFAEEILLLLHEQSNWRAKEFYLSATAYATLNQYAKGRAAFEQALVEVPQQLVWRYEFALFLYRHGRFQETQQELLTILEQQPRHMRAQDFLLKVTERLAD
jgi:tetratricopeptide (TPR) repeat protein